MYEPQTYRIDMVEPAVMLSIPTEQSELYKTPIDDHEPKLDTDNSEIQEVYLMGSGVRKSITHKVVQTGLKILKKAGGG